MLAVFSFSCPTIFLPFFFSPGVFYVPGSTLTTGSVLLIIAVIGIALLLFKHCCIDDSKAATKEERVPINRNL
jgi:hypothetical protein